MIIDKRSMYIWAFILSFAWLMVGGMSGCSNDSINEEVVINTSTTSLVLTVHGVTVTETTSDEYIASLRVIGFDNRGNIICNKRYNATDLIVKGTSPDTYIEVTQELEGVLQGGSCDFYFIANEYNYMVYNNNQPLSEFLSAQSLSVDGLKNCIIQSIEPQTAIQNILMTKYSRIENIIPGENQMGSISLVRCVAKVQLVVKNESNGNITLNEVKLKGKYSKSFSLLEKESSVNIGSSEFEVELGNNISINSEESFYNEVYLPEWLEQNPEDLKYSFSINDGKITDSYEFSAIRDESYNENVVEKGVHRNSCYTTTATFHGWEYVSIKLEIAPWDVVTNEIHWNTTPQFSLRVNKQPNTDISGKFYSIVYTATNDPEDKNDLIFTFSITEPLGSAWVFSLSNGSDFYFVDSTDPNNYKYVPNGIVESGSENVIRLRAKNPYNAEIPQETLLAVKYQMADGTWNRLIIDTEQTTSESRDVFLIKQVSAN